MSAQVGTLSVFDVLSRSRSASRSAMPLRNAGSSANSPSNMRAVTK